MEKLLKLLNEYEDSRREIIEDEEWAEITPTWRVEWWYIRHCNARSVMFEWGMFDGYIVSKKYGFIKWLLTNDKLDTDKDVNWIHMELAVSKHPLVVLISMLK